MFFIATIGQPKAAADIETSVLVQIARLRTEWLTHLMLGINAVGSSWTPTILGWGTIAMLLVFRRWRHLFVFLGSFMLLTFGGGSMIDLVARPRPFGVTIVGGWGGFSMPSPAIAVLAAVLIAIAYSLVVPGRPRSVAKWSIGVALAIFAFSRLYLAVDHPSDIVYGVILGVAIPLLAFRRHVRLLIQPRRAPLPGF